ncbi:hypothetical protein J3R82DRAFT_3156 [Butyriboletus roseoflavus]|nr:hypothetical protein J3R82DRAFT_3156 [Butyriboletus roseoflavus]
MAHNCVDWTTNPPTRKMPLLILTHGDDHVYTVVPTEFRTLEQVARREFDLGGVEIMFSSSCLNLCDGLAARITESAWEHMSRYIGCATVEILGPRAVPPQGRLWSFAGHSNRSRQVLQAASANTEDQRDPNVKRELPSNTDKGPDHGGLDSKPNVSAREAVRADQSAPSDHGNDHNSASAPEDDQQEEPREEEVSAIPPRKSRNRRRVVSEDEGEDEDSEREHQVPARSQVPPIASPPKPTQPSGQLCHCSCHLTDAN